MLKRYQDQKIMSQNGFVNNICQNTPVPMCFLIKAANDSSFASSSQSPDVFQGFGAISSCYSRSVNLANTTIFQIPTAFIYFITIATIMIILNGINKKYTAIGRSEYSIFFQLVLISVFLQMVVECGVVPHHSFVFVHFVSLQMAMTGCVCALLFANGLLGFKIWEDGTRKSYTILAVIGVVAFVANFLVAFGSFNDWFDVSNHNSVIPFATTAEGNINKDVLLNTIEGITNTMSSLIPLNSNGNIKQTKVIGILVVNYGLNAIFILLYVVSQIAISILIVKNYWISGTVILGAFFFASGQFFLYKMSLLVCTASNHYIDGLLLQSLGNLFAFMMIYKSWDISTQEDLEFSVTSHKTMPSGHEKIH